MIRLLLSFTACRAGAKSAASTNSSSRTVPTSGRRIPQDFRGCPTLPQRHACREIQRSWPWGSCLLVCWNPGGLQLLTLYLCLPTLDLRLFDAHKGSGILEVTVNQIQPLLALKQATSGRSVLASPKHIVYTMPIQWRPLRRQRPDDL